MIRSLIKTGTANALAWTRMGDLLGHVSRLRNGPLVVTYHRVVEDFASSAETSMPSLLVSRRTLEQHLDCIGRRFRFISLDELGERLESRKDFQEPVAALTIDDGYQDFYHHAFPVLRERRIPAAVFVVTDTIGTKAVPAHDKLYLLLSKGFSRGMTQLRDSALSLPNVSMTKPFEAARTLLGDLPQAKVRSVIQALEAQIPIPEETLKPFYALTWKMLDEMRREGISVGSHTRTHVLMTNEGRERVLDEATSSRVEIERRLGIKVRHFAYPDGRFDAASVDAVAAAGYRFAYTTCAHRDSRRPLLTVPRIGLWEHSCRDSSGAFSCSILNCQINRIFEFVNPCRQDHGTSPRNEYGRL